MDKKLEVLSRYFGYTEFRGAQEELIDAVLDRRDVLGIMPTGGGKSLCYQIPALLLPGITLVISPLISLMQDQVLALKTAGIPAAYLNSSLSLEQRGLVFRNLRQGRYKILYAAPERLLGEGFLAMAREVPISLVAVDEAHCISQWGQDFRPSYLKIPEFLQALPRRPVVCAYTATATPTVRRDIQKCLGLLDPLVKVTGFDRPNLRFEVRVPESKRGALLSLLALRKDKSGIVYCSTRKEVDQVCSFLLDRNFAAARYHAGLSDELGLTIGCLLFNITFAAALPLDFVIGSAATLIAAEVMWLTRKVTVKGFPLLGMLMPAMANAILVGWELTVYIGGGFGINAVYVAIGEAVVLLVLGAALYYAMKKRGLDQKLFAC